MGTLQDGFITDIGNLPKELQDRINNGLQTQIIKEAELVKNDMPDYYLSYLDGEIGKAGASMQRMIEESGRDGALLANISKVYVWNKERRKALYNLKETYLRNNEQAVKQPQPEAQITAHEPQPSFLQVEKVVQAFERGVEHGYIIKHDGKYKWIKDKGTLLCALIGTLLFGDEIGSDGDYKTKGGAETFPASDIENYFGLKDISKKRYQLNQKKPPRGYKEMKKKLIEQP